MSALLLSALITQSYYTPPPPAVPHGRPTIGLADDPSCVDDDATAIAKSGHNCSELAKAGRCTSDKIKDVCKKSCNNCPHDTFPPRKPINPSAFTVPADVACEITPDGNFTHRTSPTGYFFNIPPDAKKNGVVFVFHGGGGDEYTMLGKVPSVRMAAKHLLTDMKLGVVSPASGGSGSGDNGWNGVMCDGREKGAKPRAENPDIQNLLQIVADLKADGHMDDDTPIVTWGFSNGCNPALEMRTCGPSQVKLAMCGGTVSQMWYGVGGITGESTVVTTGVDNTTTTPIFLHIGKQDNFKSLPDAWTSDWNKTHRADIPNGFSPSAGAISKIYYQEQAFSWLQGPEQDVQQCENEPYYLVAENFRQVCGTTSDQHQTLFDYFKAHGYIDDKGLVQTMGPYDPAKGVNKTVVNAAMAAAGMGSDQTTEKLVDGVLRDAYAGHVPSLRCWPDQAAFIRKVLGLR